MRRPPPPRLSSPTPRLAPLSTQGAQVKTRAGTYDTCLEPARRRFARFSHPQVCDAQHDPGSGVARTRASGSCKCSLRQGVAQVVVCWVGLQPPSRSRPARLFKVWMRRGRRATTQCAEWRNVARRHAQQTWAGASCGTACDHVHGDGLRCHKLAGTAPIASLGPTAPEARMRADVKNTFSFAWHPMRL